MNINSRTSKINFTGFKSGAIASFTGLREAPIKVRAYINAIQEGSGDPAPDNIRPIIGRNSVTITANAVDHMISLGDTVYGGYIDVASGVLTVTKIYKQIPPQNLGISVSTITYVSGDMKSGNALAGMCDTFKTVNSSGSYGVRFGANNTTIYFYNLMNNIPEITDLDTAKQWFTEHPVNVCYELRTPITVQLTPTQVEQIIGTNNIFSDSGTVEVYYVTI